MFTYVDYNISHHNSDFLDLKVLIFEVLPYLITAPFKERKRKKGKKREEGRKKELVLVTAVSHCCVSRGHTVDVQ